MYMTERYENLDLPQKREIHLVPPFAILKSSFYSLRIGLLFQLASVNGICLAYALAHGTLFSYTLTGAEEHIATSYGFRITAAVCTFIHVLGTIFIAWFQVLLADDAAWNRGFRSGSKLIGYAASFDVLSGVIQFVLFFQLATKFSPLLLAQFSQGGPEWLLTAFARLLHAISFLLYGQGFFLLEAYDDHGTSTLFGIAIFVLYAASGIIEVLSLGFICSSIPPLLNGLSLIVAFTWALVFEHQVNCSAPDLHETELTNDIEQTVNNYARLGPMATELEP